MIVDNIKNCEMYYKLNKGFEKAFDFIKKAVRENLPIGKYEIDGNEVYALIQEYKTKLKEEGKFEGHRKYIDIQYIISGIEKIDVIDISKLESNIEYNEEKDIEFYKDNSKTGNVVLEEGEYAIFYPTDIHKPGMVFDSITDVKKIVVKVKLT